MSLVKIANKLPKLNGKFFGAYVLPPIPTYKITLFPSQNGSISADTLEGIEGTLVTLSNTPDTHYSFGGYGITGATLTGNQFLIGQDDISVQGTFIEDAKYSLSLTQTTGGSINANKNTGYAGDIITLSNTPSSHYTFNGYSITGATLTGNQFAFGSQNVTAKGTFVADPIRTVTLTQVAGGNIAANPTTGYDGTTVTLSNTANAGYTFNNYTLTGGTLTGNKFVLNGGDATASLNLTHNVYNLTVQTDGHGKLTASKSTGYYNDTASLSTTASAGYAFNNYSVTGGTINGNTFTFGTSNATAKANFNALTVRSAILTQVSGGTITASPMTGYDGTTVTLSNTADNGFTLSNYSLTGATLTSNKFVFNGSNVTAKPTWNHNVYSLTLQTNSSNAGNLTASRTTGYYNTTGYLTARPSAGYSMSGFTVTGGTITNVITGSNMGEYTRGTFTFKNSNATAKAWFGKQQEFYMSGLFTPVMHPSKQTTSISFTGNETKQFTFSNYGILTVKKQTNVPAGWIQTFNGSSYYHPTQDFNYVDYSARMSAALSVYVGSSPKMYYKLRESQSLYLNTIVVDDEFSAYVKAYGTPYDYNQHILSHNYALTPVSPNYTAYYGGPIHGDLMYFDEVNRYTTFRKYMPGLLTWRTNVSGAISSTTSPVTMIHHISGTNYWMMSGYYVV